MELNINNKFSPADSDNIIILEQVYKQFYKPLYFYAIKFVKRHEVAKDMVQDAFYNLMDTKNEINNLKGYLFQTVRNNCINHLKNSDVRNKFAEKERERIIREVEFYDTHKTLVEEELHLILFKAINELPENYKTIIELSRIDELKNREIAEKLKIPLRTVETRIYWKRQSN